MGVLLFNVIIIDDDGNPGLGFSIDLRFLGDFPSMSEPARRTAVQIRPDIART